MKRYTILAEDGFPMSYEEGVEKTEIIQDTKGEWVKWDDVQELIQTLKEARLVVDGVCDEYRGYLVTLRKIDKVLNNIEGTN